MRYYPPPEVRFWALVDRRSDSECWPWIGRQNRNGYGAGVNITGGKRGRYVVAHRFAWMLLRGAIPDGLVLDHLCRNRLCCNPAHLEPVTQREDLMRGNTIVATCASKTQCPQGHHYDEANTYYAKSGHRHCRECMRRRARAYEPRRPRRDHHRRKTV